MTIANVLRLNGIDVERSISATGKVLFRTKEAVTTGAPLKPHTFHGGVAPTDADSDAETAWWQQEGALATEVEQMATWYPGFTMIDDPASPPSWIGEINTERGRYSILIAHRRDHGLPIVAPLAPTRLDRRIGHKRNQPSPHLFLNGALCVASTEDWDPTIDTAATVVGWSAHWAAMHAEWRFTGKWPTEGYAPNGT